MRVIAFEVASLVSIREVFRYSGNKDGLCPQNPPKAYMYSYSLPRRAFSDVLLYKKDVLRNHIYIYQSS